MKGSGGGLKSHATIPLLNKVTADGERETKVFNEYVEWCAYIYIYIYIYIFFIYLFIYLYVNRYTYVHVYV